MGITHVVGIDEVGRGPVAGPVTVGAVALPASFDAAGFAGFRDSKQLSASRREEWYERIRNSQCIAGYASASASSSRIDRSGIERAVRGCIKTVLRQLDVSPDTTLVLLDGRLAAPEQYVHQRTIIRGDETEIPIALASVVAKVRRDRLMVRYGAHFPEYGFERHKGYGTAAHYAALVEHGTCAIHRQSFLSFIDASSPVE